jgi:predicted PurR-regulated permease PerM
VTYAHAYPHYRDALLIGLREQEAHGLLRALPASARNALNTLVTNSDTLLAATARHTLPGLVRLAPRLIELIAVPIVAYYLLTDYRRFIELVRRLVRPGGRERFDRLIGDIDRSLRGYLVGQAILSLVAGGAAFVILQLNGVRPAIVVGLAAAVLELVPVIGPLLWVLAAVLLTAIQQPAHTVLVAVLVLAVHQADMHLLAPRILGHHLRLHPVVVIFALLAGNALAGILGILLAAPLAALLNITLTYVLTEGALSSAAVESGDENPFPPAAPGPPVQGETARPREQATTRARARRPVRRGPQTPGVARTSGRFATVRRVSSRDQ